jgi:hypothetical protein
LFGSFRKIKPGLCIGRVTRVVENEPPFVASNKMLEITYFRLLSCHKKQLRIADPFILQVLVQDVRNPTKMKFSQVPVVLKNSQARARSNPEVPTGELA